MRVDGWEKRLKSTVERHRDMDGAWGKSECWVLAQDTYRAVTGEDLAPHLSGYKSEAGGYKLFARHGFKSVGEALAAYLPECPVLMVQRGDLGVIERGGLESCGVVMSTGLAVKTLYDDGSARLEFHPVTALTRAFKVR